MYANKDTLSNFPLIDNLDSIAFTGDYNNLSNRPDLTVLLSQILLANIMTSVSAVINTYNDYHINNTVYLCMQPMIRLARCFQTIYDLNNVPDLSVYATNDSLGAYVLTDSIGTLASQNSDDVVISGGVVAGILISRLRMVERVLLM